MVEPARSIDDPNRELPAVAVTPEPHSSPRLNETAEAIGSAVGAAVETVRNLPERLQDMKERFTVIRGRTREDAASKAAELKETAKQRAREARSRAAQLAREYPLHVIAAVAGIAFLAGFALRIWRSKRA